MIFSAASLTVLKNFADINPHMLFRAGTVLETMDPAKSIRARAQVDIDIPAEAGVHDLPRFLATLSLFKDPDVKFAKDKFIISDGSSRSSYTYSSASLLIVPSGGAVSMPAADLRADVAWSALNSVDKAAKVLQLPDIVIEANEDGAKIVATTVKDPTSDKFEVDLNATSDAPLSVFFERKNLNMLPLDYTMSVSARGIIEFSAPNMTYWVACNERK